MSTSTTTSAEDAIASDAGFDFRARVDELRCRSTEAVRALIAEARREQQRWRLEELAATRVLDDRDALGRMPDATVSARTARATVEVARALETRPALAAAAHAGTLSWDQLQPLTEIATPETDAEWARRGVRLAPVDLQRMARRARVVTAEDARARREARSVTTWREPEWGMSCGRWRLPDVDGVLVEKVLEHMAERMRPPTGEPWDSLAHRKADALVDLATSYADVEPTGRFRVEIVEIHQDDSATAEIDGIPVAAETLAALRPNAKIRECRVDETGRARTIRKPRTAIPADVERHVRRRDRTCRVFGCEQSRRLQIHHVDPVCDHGDTQDVRKLAAVCPHHHRLLEPHGPWRLVGNAEEPDGLRLVHRDDRARDGPSGG